MTLNIIRDGPGHSHVIQNGSPAESVAAKTDDCTDGAVRRLFLFEYASIFFVDYTPNG